MKIDPLKLLGDEGVVKPLQFIRRHIEPPEQILRVSESEFNHLEVKVKVKKNTAVYSTAGPKCASGPNKVKLTLVCCDGPKSYD